MSVLVAYATRHGSTAGISKHIAATLTDHGTAAEARPVQRVTTLEPHDAIVLGGAAYMFHWLKPVVRFARKRRSELAARPVWLFSSGPLGTDQVDEQGRDVREASRPREFDEMVAMLHPRGEAVFFGAYDPDQPPIGLAERIVRHMPAAPDTPAGDFRDWAAIDVWAEEIAASLAREST